ncbi:MAG: transketolase [Planctomycetota bacterium]
MTKNKLDISKLQSDLGGLARQFRKEILEIISGAGSGHPGGSLSCVEILITLYYYQMKHRPAEPAWPGRDRFILSKGHACSAVYVTLTNRGYFPKEELKTFRKLNSRLQGHIHTAVPGVELSTGSLGQGLSVANGIALAARLWRGSPRRAAKMRQSDFKIYCLLGDGEIQEGQVWEAAMTAGVHKLDNLCAIIDYNKVQQNGPVAEIKDEEPLAAKWQDFGWNAVEVDGHNFPELIRVFDEFAQTPIKSEQTKNKPRLHRAKPTVIIAHTVKGKGVSFMEGQNQWHGKAPNQEQLAQALKELGY